MCSLCWLHNLFSAFGFEELGTEVGGGHTKGLSLTNSAQGGEGLGWGLGCIFAKELLRILQALSVRVIEIKATENL
jgi:hypothetical protein